MQDYNRKLSEFVSRLTAEQKEQLTVMKYFSQVDNCYAYFESGRKYDKIVMANGPSHSVRYFVEKSTGTIYGARSRLAPNLRWWFGTLDTIDQWFWGGFHGVPKNPDNFILRGKYGPYECWTSK